MSETIAQRFTAARDKATAAVRKGGPGANGIEVARQLSRDVDVIVQAVAAPELAKCRTPVAILATGGFGRGELAPFSDLDLLFLCAERPGADVQTLAEAILHPLWDAKVDAGHAVRSFEQALSLPASDLAAATALLDARFLVGDAPLAEKFLAEFRARIAATAPQDFVARLRAEQRSRHSRFGDTIFLLEPDLKNGPGGMRDLCVGRWAAAARFGTSDPRELQGKGVMTSRLATAFVAATEWLLRVRIAMHGAAGRRQDHLRFPLQEAIAPVMCPEARDLGGVIRPAVHPAVEALMHQYHAHAKLIRNETERLLQRASLPDEKRRTTGPIFIRPGAGADKYFVVREGQLEAATDDLFEKHPAEMIRAFSLAIDLNLTLALRTRELIAEHAASHPEALRADPDAGSRFVELLCDSRDTANPSRLEQMQDLGVLAAMMPEWEPSTGRVQHDIYHVYTVDQHALYAVGRLHAIARGDHADHFPVPTETIQEVKNRTALTLGTLLHDVGKPYGSPHSEIGAGIAVTILKRMGRTDDDIKLVEFLVRQHLVMGQMSQRRDLEDLGMIADFAALCENEENLRTLYLLTFCDLASVAPDALTSWKETLLRELYARTLNYLRRGPDLLGAERAEIVKRRQTRAARMLNEDPEGESIAALYQGFPDRYFAENTAKRIAAHMELLRSRRERLQASVVEVVHERRLGVTEMVLAARDTPGLLAEVAGVLYANRVEVVDAAIYSRRSSDPKNPAEALDVFRVRDTMGRAVTDDSKWKKVRADIEGVLSGKMNLADLVATRPKGDSVVAWKTPAVPTELKIDNGVSRDFTVVEVITEDRPGVLYAITRTLAAQGLDIHRSKIATEANRVIDVFYVRDKATGEKVLDGERLADLRTALLASLPER
ncbi:MAG TPA: [protein-PII] uridylyltransferase [Polyangia bacterium]|nr:[protein-PII] uridylyltransferase [Polyangia bacterium]